MAMAISMDGAGLVPARLALGASMLHHGRSKLRGEGADQAGRFFEQVGLRPGRRLAVLTGAAELFAGAAAILGIMTRPAAVAVLVTQAFAIAKVHAKAGYDTAKGGYEYNLALMAIAAGILLSGPGPLSAERALARRLAPRTPRGVLRRVRAGRASRTAAALALLR